MYEAYAAASGNPPALPPYLLPPNQVPAIPGADPASAVAGSAYRALVALYPRQRSMFDARLGALGLPLTAASRNGLKFGRAVADRLLQLRSSDPIFNDTPHPPPAPKPAHRPDPQDPRQPNHGRAYGSAKPFASANNLVLNPPPYGAGLAPAYLTALTEVRSKGIKPEYSGTVPVATLRTTDETMVGVFWGYDGAMNLGTPPRLYNQILRELAASFVPALNVGQQARMFALANAAMGDAGILAWREKYKHNFWRPVVGIREHDASLGWPPGTSPGAVGALSDTNWLPFGAPKSNVLADNFTPPFPAYPSGHATFGAAAFGVVRHYLERLSTGQIGAFRANGPDNFFTGGFVSDECNGQTTDGRGVVRPRHVRAFPGGLWQMIIENGRSRVFLGVHWVFDAFAVDNAGNPDLTNNIGGVKLGLDIAHSVMANGLQQQP